MKTRVYERTGHLLMQLCLNFWPLNAQAWKKAQLEKKDMIVKPALTGWFTLNQTYMQQNKTSQITYWWQEPCVSNRWLDTWRQGQGSQKTHTETPRDNPNWVENYKAKQMSPPCSATKVQFFSKPTMTPPQASILIVVPEIERLLIITFRTRMTTVVMYRHRTAMTTQWGVL